MTRTTSAAAYRKLVDEGGLSRARSMVYACVYNHGPLTELDAHDRLSTPENPVAWSTVTGRFSELETMGLIQIVGSATNKRGSVVHVWDVTDLEDPKPLPKRTPTQKERADRFEALLGDVARFLDDKGQRKAAQRIRERIQEVNRIEEVNRESA